MIHRKFFFTAVHGLAEWSQLALTAKDPTGVRRIPATFSCRDRLLPTLAVLIGACLVAPAPGSATSDPLRLVEEVMIPDWRATQYEKQLYSVRMNDSLTSGWAVGSGGVIARGNVPLVVEKENGVVSG